jgi:hypothetical protein
MVASQQANKGGKNKLNIEALRKKGNHCDNVKAWERSLNTSLSTVGWTIFLDPESGVQVPENQADKVWMEYLCNEQVYANRTLLAKREKISHLVPIKVESVTPLKSSSGRTPKKQPKAPSEGSGLNDIPEEIEFEEGSLSAYEKNIRENCLKMAKNKLERMKREEGSGQAKMVLFCNPYSMCDPDQQKAVNPRANILIDENDAFNPFGETKMFELEDSSTRQDRLTVWENLYDSVKSAVEKSLLLSVPVGNTFLLYTLVQKHLRLDQRRNIVKKIDQELKGLKKKANELFINFRSRYEGIISEMKEWKYEKDNDEMKTIMKEALRAECDLTMKIYTSVTTTHGVNLTNERLLDLMDPLMDEHEKDQAIDRAKERKSKKEREKLEKAITLALKTQNNSQNEKANKGENGKNKGKKGGKGGKTSFISTDDDIHNVCTFFQNDKCTRKECSFKHVKLNDEQKKRLFEKVKQKVSDKTPAKECYNCGKAGHLMKDCKSKKKTRSVAIASTENQKEKGDDKIADILEAVLGSNKQLSDSQICLLAKSIGNALSKEEQQSQS